MKPRGSSRLPGFYRLSPDDRRARVVDRCDDTYPEGLSVSRAESMIENVVGVFGMPLGVATNFVINGHDVLVPMAVEEPSVVAAASNGARMARQGGGFRAEADQPLTVSQIKILGAPPGAPERILAHKDQILDHANSTQPELVSLGGGAIEIQVRGQVGGEERTVVHLIVDCRDAMGANMVNTMAEAISGRVAQLANGNAGLRILTNLADRRLARSSCTVPVEALSRDGFPGEKVCEGVVRASDFAAADPYRAATHNKGIFNGIDACLIASGNDWRAVEAGGHAFAGRGQGYSPLATWELSDGELCGSIEMPMAVGIVGGAARTNPSARESLDLLGVETGSELAQIVVSVGLSTNLAALAALASEGIQRGHMRLHGRKND